MLGENNCCVTLTRILYNRPFLRLLSVDQNRQSPVQPLKPQTHITSMGLETDPQPDELFLQNSIAHYQQSRRAWETKATPTTITTLETAQPRWQTQERSEIMTWWNYHNRIQMKKCSKATTERRTKVLNSPEKPPLQSDLTVGLVVMIQWQHTEQHVKKSCFLLSYHWDILKAWAPNAIPPPSPCGLLQTHSIMVNRTLVGPVIKSWQSSKTEP